MKFKTNPMKTSKMTMLGMLVAITLGTQSAVAFYNPQTGRWLSRDPIAEKGGKHIYGFTLNTPINRYDRLGLFVNVQGNNYCNYCIPISMDPLKKANLGFYEGSPTTIKWGSAMTVTWRVKGNPEKCTYSQNEHGYIDITPLFASDRGGMRILANWPDVRDAPRMIISYGEDTATYVDNMGVTFEFAKDTGLWRIRFNFTIYFWAHGTDGRNVRGETVKFDADVVKEVKP